MIGDNIVVGFNYGENKENTNILETLVKANQVSVFLREGIITKYTLPKPSEDLIGKRIYIINAGSNVWKINVEEGKKIGGQLEKSLSKNGQYLKLICDGEKYFIL